MDWTDPCKYLSGNMLATNGSVCFLVDGSSDFPAPGGSGGPRQPPSCWAVDFGLDTFKSKSLWDKLMSPFHQAVLRSSIQHALSTQHGLVLAIGGSWRGDISRNRPMPFVLCRKRGCFAGVWANASAPPVIMGAASF